ncbi:hypothetical protein LJC07_06380 [Christensenellaceae bacterium OttesenSCG-928-L17]|nr:hypothetical protein [Christensenellaceae bacterium OttesenSCG-928-L17]
MKKLLPIAFVAASALALLVPLANVAAEEADEEIFRIGVSPAKLRFDISPCESYTGAFDALNTGNVPMSVKVALGPYSGVDDNDSNENKSTRYAKMHEWTEYSPKEFELPNAGDKQKISFTIDVPCDVVSASQYMTFALTTARLDNDDAGVTSLPAVGLNVYATVEGNPADPKATLLSHTLPSFYFSPPIKTSVTIRNDGNIDIAVRNSIEVFNFFADESDPPAYSYSTFDNPSYILPETTRTFLLDWREAPLLGIFKVKSTVAFLDETFYLEKTVIILPIFVIVLFILIIALGIVLIVSRAKSRKQKISTS